MNFLSIGYRTHIFIVSRFRYLQMFFTNVNIKTKQNSRFLTEILYFLRCSQKEMTFNRISIKISNVLTLCRLGVFRSSGVGRGRGGIFPLSISRKLLEVCQSHFTGWWYGELNISYIINNIWHLHSLSIDES